MAKAKTTLKVDGMSCEHCVRNVTDALEELDGVKKAKVSLKKGLAKLKYDADKVSGDDLIKAVESAGYEASLA